MPTTRHSLAFALLPTLALAVAGCNDDDNDGSGLTQEEFRADLRGSNEVPPVASSATGSAAFAIIDDTSFSYTVATSAMTGVIQAHIHSGSAGENGPIRVFLFGPADPPLDVAGGTLATGTVGPGDLDGIGYDELLDQMRNEAAYVNVHTVANPAGEIRGQIETN